MRLSFLCTEEAPDSADSSSPEDVANGGPNTLARPRSGSPQVDMWEPTADMWADYEAHQAGLHWNLSSYKDCLVQH